MTTKLFSLRLTAIRYETDSIASFEFQALSGEPLQPFSPGAHVDVHLPGGLIRSYSLCNNSAETHRYVVAVARDPASRGGSTCMHDQLRVGQVIGVSAPANHFPLFEEASETVLIAGGVGVTPIWCMAQRLHALDRKFSVFYAARARRHAAFAAEFEALSRSGAATVHLHYDDEHGPFEIHQALSGAPSGAHFYCCGPVPMLQAFEAACASIPPGQVHLEYFKAKDVPVTAGGLELVLAKSKKTLQVGSGQTVLDAVLEAGIDIPYSCMEGICGSCEVTVLEGVPDHHDSVLSSQQKRANRSMLICCSGSKSPRLVLDL